MIEEEDIFIESIFKKVYDDIDHVKIHDYINYLMNREEKGVVISNKGGWQYHVKDGECEAIDYLQDQLLQTAHQILYEKYSFDIKSLCRGGIWINVNYSGNYNVDHNHTGSVLSCCYYLQTPEPMSAIEFIPHDSLSRTVIRNEMEKCDSEFLGDDNPRIRMGVRKIPKEREAYFFTGHLTHRVDINNSVEPRISLAANFCSSPARS